MASTTPLFFSWTEDYYHIKELLYRFKIYTIQFEPHKHFIPNFSSYITPNKKMISCLTCNSQIRHKINETSIWLLDKLNLVGILSINTRQTKIFTFLGTKGFHLVSILMEGRIRSSIHLRVSSIVNKPYLPISHHHISRLSLRTRFWRHSIKPKS